MNEIDEIKSAKFQTLRKQEVVMLVREAGGWRVEQWLTGGVAPSSSYDSPEEAAARACQLLKLTAPVTPQRWPEVAQIGGDGTVSPPKNS